MNNYLLESLDFVALKKEIDKIIKETKFQEAAISTYDISEVSLENALEDLDTYSFLTTQKIIIINNIEVINQDLEEDNIKHLYKYLDNPNPDNLLIITAKKLNNTYKITKELKKRLQYKLIELNPETYIKNELKDYTLEPGVIKLLVDYSKGDITKLENECIKLKNYSIDTKKITKKDISELVVEKLGDQQDLTFAFSRALAERNKKEALEKYKELLNYQIEPLQIIGLLASQIRIIYQVKVLTKQNMTPLEISRQLQEKSDYRVKKTKELIYLYTEEELLKLMTSLADMDLQIKTTDIDPNSLIELFILNI